MNKAKRILELKQKIEQLKYDDLIGEVSTNAEIIKSCEEDIIKCAVELAREVERDYVRKDKLLGWLKEYCGVHTSGDRKPYIFSAEDLIEAINSGELDGDS